eukprot:TRINITY_DN2144_c1_g2_i1.p1 TRINITY_DN2144_c1_g2~~TRINITY_DN2144_c1_g2_i1.p1  ORF type:complete len:1900 (+),score=510.41 TRINITY_DN2144_c1_g2_i1:93-5792(+)
MWAVGVVLVLPLSVLAGDAACSTDPGECFYLLDDAAFGDAESKLSSASGQQQIAEKQRFVDAVCSRENWRKYETCHLECPLQLHITNPPHLRMRTCLEDNIFSPTDPTAHITDGHPLNGAELDMIASPPGSRDSCTAEDLAVDGRNYTGKVVLVSRGTCYFYKKAQTVYGAGGSAMVMINSHLRDRIREQLLSMSGLSDGFPGMPAVSAPLHYGDVLFKALDSGEHVKVKITFGCMKGDVQPADSFNTSCPDARLVGLCDRAHNPEDRLCSYCPLWVTFDGNASFCLYGNSLFPRRAENTLEAAVRDGPVSLDVALVDAANGGCQVSDFDGLAGKVVVMGGAASCIKYAQVLAASQAGVAGIVILNPSSSQLPEQVEGLSNLTSTPVHTVLPSENGDLIGAITAGTLIVNTASVSAWSRTGQFTAGVPGTLAPTPQPSEAQDVIASAVEPAGDFEVSALIAVMAVLIVGLLVALVLKAMHSASSAANIQIETDAEPDGVHVPLYCATLGVTLILLLATSGIVFAQTYAAGVESTDAAMGSAEKTMERCHAAMVQNIESLAQLVRDASLRSMRIAVEGFLDEGEREVTQFARLYAFYRGTWRSFDSVFPFLVEQSQQSAWSVAVRTTQGFYSDPGLRTDDRSDEERADGHQHVSVTQNGHLYNLTMHWYDADEKTIYYWAELAQREWPVFQRVGTAHGDPLGLVEGKPQGFVRWYVMDYSKPNSLSPKESPPPLFGITALTPLYGFDNSFMGVVEVIRDVQAIADAAVAAIRDQPNVSIVIFTKDGRVVSSSRGRPFFHSHVYKTVEVRPALQVMHLIDMTAVEMRALHFYLQGKDLEMHDGSFDQADHYQPRGRDVVLRYDFESGVKDAGEHAYKAAVHGACGDCLGDGRSGRGLLLDGSSILYIYRNLSVDLPELAALRDGGFPFATRDCYAFASTCIPVEECPAGPCGCPGTSGCGDRTASQQYYNDAASPATEEAVLRGDYLSDPVTITMWVNPAEAYTSTDFPPPESPRLYSDKLSGAGRLRWFASGVMYVRNSQVFGCLTKPIEGGLPPGQWSHMAAVVDFWHLQCHVYVNGVLHDSSSMTEADFLGGVVSSEAHGVGGGFVGSIDDVGIYRLAMDQTEVRTLVETGRFTRNVPSKDFYVRTAPIVRNNDQVQGIDWTAAVLIPVRDVLWRVEQNNEVLKSDLGEMNTDTRNTLDQKTVETALITVVVVLSGLTVFMVLNDKLTTPFAQLAKDMLEASLLRTDKFDDKQNIVSEIQVMNRAMGLLVRNIKLYRSYLPQAILHGLDHGSEMKDRRDPPRGSVAICFTDIVGSTRLWEANPAVMNVVLERHNEQLRNTLREFYGYEVKTIGDSFMVSFDDPVTAVQYGIRVNEDLLSTRWAECPEFEMASAHWGFQTLDGVPVWNGIALRCGISYGMVADEANPMTDRTDYRGRIVNLAARLEATGPVGLVHVSGELYKDVHSDPRVKHCMFYVRKGVMLRGIEANATTHVVCTRSLRGRLLLWQDPSRQVSTLARSLSTSDHTLNPLGRRASGQLRDSIATHLPALTGLTHVDTDSDSQGGRSSHSHGVTQMQMKARWHNGGVAEVTNMDGCSPYNGGDAVPVSLQLTRNLEWMQASVFRTGGKIHAVVGQMGQALWNVIGTCQHPPAEATLSFAHLLCQKATDTRVGISTGQVFYGTVGSNKARHLTTAGLVPRLASALARTAADLRVTCLTGFLTETPVRFAPAIRHVDRWLATSQGHKGGSVTVTVGEFIPQRFAQIIGELKDALGEMDRSVCVSGSENEGYERYCLLFERALTHSDGEALDCLEACAVQDPSDAVLSAVVTALKQHQLRYPQGHSYRCAAPMGRVRPALPNPDDVAPEVVSRAHSKLTVESSGAATPAREDGRAIPGVVWS